MLQTVGVEEMSKSRMGSMSLKDFGKSPQTQTDPEPMVSIAPAPTLPSIPAPAAPAAPDVQPLPKEKMVTMNIKIPAELHEWLTETAKAIRDNSTEAVPAGERVFPQHLIVAAVRRLQSADLDWHQVKVVQDLDQV